MERRRADLRSSAFWVGRWRQPKGRAISGARLWDKLNADLVADAPAHVGAALFSAVHDQEVELLGRGVIIVQAQARALFERLRIMQSKTGSAPLTTIFPRFRTLWR